MGLDVMHLSTFLHVFEFVIFGISWNCMLILHGSASLRVLEFVIFGISWSCMLPLTTA